jgi:hypothetical protein
VGGEEIKMSDDHIDPEVAFRDFARILGISVEALPKELKDSLTFICTSDAPR